MLSYPHSRVPRLRRLAALLGVAAIALVFLPAVPAEAAACSTAGITVRRVSSPVMYIDTSISPQLVGAYVGYEITNGPTAVADAWVTVEGFTGTIVRRATNEDGIQHIGPLAAGERVYAYFYLTATGATAANQTHNLAVYSGTPGVGTQLCADPFSLTVEETIQASANKVNTVVSGPNPAELGGIMTMTVTGETGQVGNAGIFAATPAARANWPANAYQLVDVRLSFATTGIVDDRLFVTGLRNTSQNYTATYTFIATGTTVAPTAVSPVNYIASGNQIKHTDTSGYASLLPILPAANRTTLAKQASPTTLPATGGTVTYAVTATNTGTGAVTLDSFRDVLPAGVAYVAGSARYNAVVIPNPTVSGQQLTFNGVFSVPAGGSSTLSYQATLPAANGSFVNSAVAFIGATQIDTTTTTTDNSPATAAVIVGSPPTADLSVTKTDAVDPVAPGDPITYTVTVANGGPNSAQSVVVTDPLPSGLTFVSAVPSQGSCAFASGVVTCNLGTLSVGVATITIVARTSTPGSVVNTASVSSSTADPVTTNNSASQTTTIAASNAPPVANDDAASTAEDTAVVVDVLVNDSDVDGNLDPSSVTVVSGPSNGTVSVNSVTGAVTYTPNPNFNGVDTFTYRVCDVVGACDTATVTVTVDSVNDAPVASDDAVSTAEDAAVVVDVLANDADVDGNLDPTSVSVVSGPSNGSVSVDPTTGAVTYTPNLDFNGSDSFTYQVCDTAGACDTATVTVTVDAVNDAPIANDDFVVVGEDSSVAIAVTRNDTDVEGNLDPTTVAIVSGPANGTATVDPATGIVTYTPDPDFNGTDSFTYEVCDTDGACGQATVTVRVDPVNDPPAAADDTATTDEDTPVVVDVLANDGDVDGNLDPSTVTILSGPSNGTVTVDTVTGAVTYTPNPDFNGADSFTYQVCDTSGACGPAVVSLTVSPVDDPPVARNDSVSALTFVPQVIDVLANDTDVDGNLDPTTVTILSGPANGTVSVDPATGDATYTSNVAFTGNDSFTYEVCDTTGLCASATVSVRVEAGFARPVAGDDTASTPEDTPVSIDVVANDSDVDGNLDAGSVTVLSGPSSGTVAVDSVTGQVTYTPNPDFNGTDSFTYEICDTTSPTPLCDSASVVVTVDPVNDPPVANDDFVSTAEDTPVTIDVTANDTDVDGNLDPTTVTIVSGPSNGTAVVDPATGAVTYTPSLNFNGIDTFTYEVCDTTGVCSTSTATVTTEVVLIDDPPVAVDDAATTLEDTPVTIDVAANDSDVDGNLDPTTVRVLAGPSNGTTVVDPVTGAVTYTPNLDFNGTDAFTYEVCDTDGACDAAVVTVTVDPVNDAPVANDDAVSTAEDAVVVVDVAANDADVDGNLDPTSVSIQSGPSNGTAVVDPATGAVTYTPNPDFNGVDSFTYEVCDTAGACDTATVTVTVDPVNDAPVANDDAVSTAEDAAVVVDVVANDVDVDGNLDPTSVSVVSGPSNGSVVVDPVSGAVTYTPDPDFNGSDSFTYQVCDTAGACGTATVTVTIGAVNDAPVAVGDTVSTAEDTAVVVDVLANDTDPEGNIDPSSVSIVSPAASGTLGVDPLTGAVTYTPGPDFNGTDSFTYQVCDTSGACSTATVDVTVTPVNDAPSVNDDAATTLGGLPVTVDVLANDTDVDGNLDPTSVAIVSGPANGTVSVDPVTGAGTYTPAPGFAGADSFTYEVCDAAGACGTATVNLAVTAGPGDAPPPPGNQPPIYSGPSEIRIVRGATPTPLDIVDPDGDGFIVLVVDGELPPGLTLNPDGTWTGVADTAGVTEVTLRVCDLFACTDFTLTIIVGALPVTGAVGLVALVTFGLGLIAAGGLMLGWRRRRPSGGDEMSGAL